MKINSDKRQVTSDTEINAAGGAPSCHPSPVTRHREKGIALVITLILLSVTLIMAVAFLAISRRERGAVVTSTDTATARLAADAALANAEAQIMASVLAYNNTYNSSLLVSTNYLSTTGPTYLDYLASLYIAPRAPVFVNTNNGSPLDFRFYLDLNRDGQFEDSGLIPETNNAGLPTGTTNFYLGDPQWIGVLERPDGAHGPNNKFLSRYAFIAVPADNALDLNAVHNQSLNQNLSANDGYFRNQGVGTWEINLAAFLADLNTNEWDTITAPYRYNEQANFNTGNAFDDARALLAYRYANNYNSLALASAIFPLTTLAGPVDLYPNQPAMTGTGTPFYNLNLNNPWAGADNTNHFFNLMSDLYDKTKTEPGVVAPVTGFTDHLLQATTNTSTYDRYTLYRLLSQLGTDSDPEQGIINLNYSNAYAYLDASGVVTNITLYPGAETNLTPWQPLQFFTIAADRMLRVYSTNWFQASPKDYLAQYYATTPPVAPDLNGYGLTNALLGTNTIPAFGITNIPVYVNGQFVYSSAIQRVLQLAANIYDASTNNTAALGKDYPSVFRPIFYRDFFGNVFIRGYQQVVIGNGINYFSPPPTSIEALVNLISPGAVSDQNVYGVPWIIGAKKGFPAFNQFSLVNSCDFERLLEVQRTTVAGLPTSTNQMVVMSITNNFGVSFWNSYSNDYSGSVTVVVNGNAQIYLTNSVLGPGQAFNFSYSYGTNFTPLNNVWAGSRWGANDSGYPQPSSFFAYAWTNSPVQSYAYDFATGKFVGTNQPPAWDSTLSPLPAMGLQTTNYLQAYILDNGHVIDYVQLRGPIDSTNLTAVLADPDYGNNGTAPYLWSTNLNSDGISWGIVNQLDISSGSGTPPASAQWKPVPVQGLPSDIAAQQDFFAAAFAPSPHTFTYNGVRYFNQQLITQAGYTASRTVFGSYLYQVNDPLVHYLASDLDAGSGATWSGANVLPNGSWYQNNGDNVNSSHNVPSVPTAYDYYINSGKGLSRYQPWGQIAPGKYSTSEYDFGDGFRTRFKDSLMWGPDSWDFPTNAFPTTGWLGRVHRGTPWQTVYLKASDILKSTATNPKTGNTVGPVTWAAWSGDNGQTYGEYYDAANTSPLQDRLLFDVFTTAPNDNATRGQLSVNVGANTGDPAAGLAAWSALFSGMVALQNINPAPGRSTIPSYGWTNIQPAGALGLSSDLGILVTNINYQRAYFTNTDGLVGAFEHKGDILSVAALTEQSPLLLNLTDVNQQKYGIGDEVYEWLPQQMMSLLHVSSAPRYVIYCYGQTLKPAPNGVVTGGNYFGMVTNYQVVAETATRALVQFNQVLVTNSVSPLTIQTNYTPLVKQFNLLPPD